MLVDPSIIAKSVLKLPSMKAYIPWVKVAFINWHPTESAKTHVLSRYPEYRKIFGNIPEYSREPRRGNLAIMYYDGSDFKSFVNRLDITASRFKKVYLISTVQITLNLPNVYLIN